MYNGEILQARVFKNYQVRIFREYDKFYKNKNNFCFSEHAELLVYDWSEEGDVDIVVEDIERIDFSHYEAHTRKMADWDLNTEEDYAVLRRK